MLPAICQFKQQHSKTVKSYLMRLSRLTEFKLLSSGGMFIAHTKRLRQGSFPCPPLLSAKEWQCCQSTDIIHCQKCVFPGFVHVREDKASKESMKGDTTCRSKRKRENAKRKHKDKIKEGRQLDLLSFQHLRQCYTTKIPRK